MLLTVQRQWMYLENIFLGEDIRRQLPRESAEFDEVNSNWKNIMTRMNKTRNALRATHHEGVCHYCHADAWFYYRIFHYYYYCCCCCCCSTSALLPAEQLLPMAAAVTTVSIYSACVFRVGLNSAQSHTLLHLSLHQSSIMTKGNILQGLNLLETGCQRLLLSMDFCASQCKHLTYFVKRHCGQNEKGITKNK